MDIMDEEDEDDEDDADEDIAAVCGGALEKRSVEALTASSSRNARLSMRQ